MGQLTATVNGQRVTHEVEARTLLSDFIRHELGLTGTHVGCEHGVCGACTVRVDGAAVRSCLMLALQIDGSSVITIEGLAPNGKPLTEVQRALGESLGLQCGFCTPGIAMSMSALLDEPDFDEEAMTSVLGGHLCRCTGYQGIRKAGRQLLDARAKRQA